MNRPSPEVVEDGRTKDGWSIHGRGGGANRVPLIRREAYSLSRGHTLLGVSRVLWAHNTVAVAREEAGVVVEVLSLGQATPLSAYFRKGPLGMPAWPFSLPHLS